MKVQSREILHLLLSLQFVEPLQGVGLPLLQVPKIVPFHLVDRLIANLIDGPYDLGRGEPAIKEYKGGIYAMVPRPLEHLDEEIGLLPEGLLPPPRGVSASVHWLREGVFRRYGRAVDRETEREQEFSIKVAQYQMANSEHGTSEGVIPHIGGQFNPLPSLRVDGVIGDEEPVSQWYRLCRFDGLEGETIDKLPPLDSLM